MALRGPAVRSGLKYGLINGIVSLALAANNIVTAISPAWRSLGHLRGLIALIALIVLPILIYATLTPVFAGRETAMRTGTVSAGTAAGVVTSVVCTLVTWPGSVVQSIIVPHMASPLIPSAPVGGALGVVWFAMWEFIWMSIGLATYALLEALGGLLGRRAYRRTLLGDEAPSRRRATQRATAERKMLLGLAIFLLVVGMYMCMLVTISAH
jgi:hypothetical protein